MSQVSICSVCLFRCFVLFFYCFIYFIYLFHFLFYHYYYYFYHYYYYYCLVCLMLFRDVFRTYPNIHDGGFSHKKLTAKSRQLFLQKSSILDVRLSFKYTSTFSFCSILIYKLKHVRRSCRI